MTREGNQFDKVVVEGRPNPMAQMIAGLIEANVADSPAKDRLLETTRGAAQIDVRDTGQTIGLKFIPGTVTVTSTSVPGADIRIVTDSETLMALSTARLRGGFPDPLSDLGRGLAGQLLRRRLRVSGLPLGLRMLRRVLQLLNVT